MLLNILFFNRLVSSESELLSVVSEGMQRRATHSTHVHEHSSRSHLIVTIHITARGEGGVSIASSVSSLQLNTTITPVSSTDSTPLVSFQGGRYIQIQLPPDVSDRLTPQTEVQQVPLIKVQQSIVLLWVIYWEQ